MIQSSVLLFLTFLTSTLIVLLVMPSVIMISKRKKLVDIPNDRSSHKAITPRLGGIAIIGGFLLGLLTWGYAHLFAEIHLVLAAIVVLFAVGLKDDLIAISPFHKLFGQLMAAVLIVSSGIYLTNLHGVMGIDELPFWFSLPFSLFVIVVIINSFNLIDGINGLSSSITLLISLLLGTWFSVVGAIGYAFLAFALAGSMIGFLKFNITPAKVFMGDSGSLVAGLIVSVLIIQFIELHLTLDSPYTFNGVPGIAISLLIFPLFDTLRVFTIRIIRGRSPLSPDRHHIHHLLIDAGYSHMRATTIIVVISIFFILLATVFQNIGTLSLVLLLLATCLILTFVLHGMVKKRRKLIALGKINKLHKVA